MKLNVFLDLPAYFYLYFIKGNSNIITKISMSNSQSPEQQNTRSVSLTVNELILRNFKQSPEPHNSRWCN